jgi:hypothetical protein
VALAFALCAIGATRVWLRARVPDDYDSIGFVRAVDQFDLARLQPHFPGYPVFVALAKAARACGLGSLAALQAVSVTASMATAAAVWRLARLFGERGAALALALYGAAAMPWLLGGAALSDGCATALAAWAFALLCGTASAARFGAGLFIGLTLGARASYFPLALSWLALLAWRRRSGAGAALAGAALGLAVWAAPLFAWVGPRALWTFGRAHVAGHFGEWGGSIVTRPGLAERGGAFVRDLLYYGFAPSGLALAFALLLGAACARAPARRTVALAALVTLPYAAWVLFAQNVLAQPRHVLPLVVAACVAAAGLAGRRLAFALPLSVAFAAAPLAWTRAHVPPAAAQAADWLEHAAPGAAVFGGRSMRFFQLMAPSLTTRERTWLSEVDVDLERLDRLPAQVFVTSEVEADPQRVARLRAGPTFCRDARLDPEAACLTLSQYVH